MGFLWCLSLKIIYYSSNWQFRHNRWENSSQKRPHSQTGSHSTVRLKCWRFRVETRSLISQHESICPVDVDAVCLGREEEALSASICLCLDLFKTLYLNHEPVPGPGRAVNTQVYRLASVWETHSDGIIHPARRKDKMVITSFSLFNIFLYRGKWLLPCKQINFSWSASKSIRFVDC